MCHGDTLSHNQKDLIGINADKLLAIHADECILNIRRLSPIYGKKFNTENHINYGKLEK